PDDLHLLTMAPAHTIHSAATQPTLNQLVSPSRRKDLPMISKHVFLQGIHPFEGVGVDKPAPVSGERSHLVPDGVIGQALYFRGGNSSAELVTVVLLRDGVAMRYFPIGAKGEVHVPLRVVEDIEGGSSIELQVAAPVGLTGTVVLDLGLVEHCDHDHGTDGRSHRSRGGPAQAGGHRQRDGWGSRGRGDPQPRWGRDVRDHHVR
ncbi:MAG: hypothetical protein ACR2LI_09960, partial [Propionibacteriaceae bacterium]